MAKKHYRLNMGLNPDVCSLKMHGLGSQLWAAASMMQIARLRGDEVHPSIPLPGGGDLWQEIFDTPPPPPGAPLCPCDELKWDALDGDAHSPAAPDLIHFKESFRVRLDHLWRNLGDCCVGLSMRDTDKLDGGECPIPPYLIARAMKGVHEPFLVFSDSTIYLDRLLPHFPDSQISIRPRMQATSIFPLHRSRGASPILTGDRLNQHTLEIFEDIYLMTKMKTIYYPVWHGVLMAASLLSRELKVISCRERLLSVHEIEMVNFYRERECALWRRLDDRIEGAR